MRQLLVESLLLAVTGAALGVAAGYWGLPAVLRLLPPNSVPVGNLMAVPVNVPVLLFTAGLAMASALVSGLSPTLSFSRPRLTATARTTAGVQSRRASSPNGLSCSPIGSGSDTSADGLRQWGRPSIWTANPTP